ncbi:DNA-3-methyladenine glycosylase [Chitinophaga sp. 212800010-3]|uniref:DNA-3-methyladenine glycosylase n=1 Tax=unclassified Chitinophaga TaxID=2619133 RepID=UPI002DF6B39A|nr:putative 3-methyladenine DNA glycosylase [Chitinophaga sp. 212800010-3]
MAKINASFYQREDVLLIAQQLLGSTLVTNINGVRTAGIIVETEAYAGVTDRASHAWNNRRTNRTAVMYEPGGVAYVYLCYGIHYLFNIVTNVRDTPQAVLVRALEPVDGLEIMKERTGNKNPLLTAGPGALSKAMGIDLHLNGSRLSGNKIWVEQHSPVSHIDMAADTRVGVQYAGADAFLPYRFYIKNNKWVSKGKGLTLPLST